MDVLSRVTSAVIAFSRFVPPPLHARGSVRTGENTLLLIVSLSHVFRIATVKDRAVD